MHLDGFLFELPGREFYKDVESFGEGVCRVLTCISDADPAGYHCMNKSFLSKVGWSFEFNKVPIFVTTFSACYPDNHSRYVDWKAENATIVEPRAIKLARLAKQPHELYHNNLCGNKNLPDKGHLSSDL